MDATVLLTGATGYIGGRLLRRLEEGGRAVRCLVRQPGQIAYWYAILPIHGLMFGGMLRRIAGRAC